MIMLLAIDIVPHFNNIWSFMGFWSTSINTFIFPWGMATSTLLGVATILGLPLWGKDVHSYTDQKIVDLGYVYVGDVYSTFITKNAKKTQRLLTLATYMWC